MKNILYTIILSFLLLSCDTTVTTTTADFQAGLDAYQAGDYATALKEFRSLAEQGNVDAQYNIGVIYHQVEGVTQDYKKALKWYRLAAEQGDVRAQHNLGNMYYRGQGVTQDYKEAAKWYRLAAEQGLALSQHDLGLLYEKGQGLTENYVIAHMWFNIAARDGNEAAKTSKDEAESLMTSEQLVEAQKLARECIKKNYKDCG